MTKKTMCRLILLCSLFLITSAGASEGTGMQRLINSNVPDFVSNQIKDGNFIFAGGKMLLREDQLQGWFIETVKGGTNIWDTYEKKYKNKEKIIPDNNSRLNYEDLSVYNMIIQSCGGWTDKIFQLYNYSLQDRSRAPVIDVTCNRLINPVKNRAYDAIFMVNQKEDFLRSDADLRERNKELMNLKGEDSKSYDGYIFRYARYVEPTKEDVSSINNFSLVQLMAERFMPRGGFLEIFEFGKMRDKDTYILVLTGQRTKLIIQTFYDKGTLSQELEKELYTILHSITITP